MDTAISPDNPINLGPAIASYGPRRRRWREAWVWPLPGFILAGVLIITGLDWYYYGYTQYGPIAAQAWSQDWLFWGIFIGVITLFITAWQMISTQVRIDLFKSGIQVYYPLHAARTFRWEDITGIASASIQDSIGGRTLRTRHRLIIYLTTEKPLSLDDRIGNLLELATRLKAKLYPRLLPGLRARFHSGQQLSFGPVLVQMNYISIRGKQITWNQVSRITIVAGHLVIEILSQASDRPQHLRLPASQIPNLELLLQVLQRGLT